MTTVRANVWMASPEHIGRSFKWWLHQDAGQLQLAPGPLRFRGRSRDLSMPTVVAVSLVRQRVPWLSILLGIGLAAAVISSGLFRTATWDDPITVGLFFGLSVFVFLATGPVQWVKVEYRDGAGASEVAYFLEGAGLSRFFGGTRKLYAEIQAAVFQPQA